MPEIGFDPAVDANSGTRAERPPAKHHPPQRHFEFDFGSHRARFAQSVARGCRTPANRRLERLSRLYSWNHFPPLCPPRTWPVGPIKSKQLSRQIETPCSGNHHLCLVRLTLFARSRKILEMLCCQTAADSSAKTVGRVAVLSRFAVLRIGAQCTKLPRACPICKANMLRTSLERSNFPVWHCTDATDPQIRWARTGPRQTVPQWNALSRRIQAAEHEQSLYFRNRSCQLSWQ